MMKKLMAGMLALALLACAAAGFAQDEQAQEDAVLLTGTILETAEDHVLLDVPELGEVQAWVTEETVIEGVDALAAYLKERITDWKK